MTYNLNLFMHLQKNAEMHDSMDILKSIDICG